MGASANQLESPHRALTNPLQNQKDPPLAIATRRLVNRQDTPDSLAKVARNDLADNLQIILKILIKSNNPQTDRQQDRQFSSMIND